MENQVKCPKCGSEQISANKKGYSVGKAAAGVVLTGGIGLVAGAIGSGDIKITCLLCGHSWNPKTLKKQKDRNNLAMLQNSNAEFLIWKQEFYKIYDSGDFEKAKEHFLQKRVFNNVIQDVHQAYISMKKQGKSDQKFRIGCVLFAVIIFTLIIYWAS